jgi:FKBP-type peptidyl-prolyl cis-trans isomerase FkpA
MTKNKKLWLSGTVSLFVLLLLIGGGVYILHGQKSGLTAQELADASASRAQSLADAAPSNNATPLTTNQSTAPTSASSSGLSTGTVQGNSRASSSSLGQLNTSSQTGIPTPASTNQSSSTNSGNVPSNPFDPTTFAQYDKYDKEQSSLMADAQAGTGATLEAGKKAVVYYRGWLTNGTLFDQSRTDSSGKLQPFSFTVGAHQVISGWDQGLIGMKVGGVRLLIVPPAAGYGSTAQGSIPANSLLVFQVQLVAVQ